jgi:hypothetical protein
VEEIASLSIMDNSEPLKILLSSITQRGLALPFPGQGYTCHAAALPHRLLIASGVSVLWSNTTTPKEAYLTLSSEERLR